MNILDDIFIFNYTRLLLARARDQLGASSYGEVPQRINALNNEKDALKKQNEQLSTKLAHANSESIKAEFAEQNGLFLSCLMLHRNSLYIGDQHALPY